MKKKLKRIFFIRTGLGQGGADRVTLTLLENMPQDANKQFYLVLMRKHGELVADVPPHIKIIDLKCPHLSVMMPFLLFAIIRLNPDVLLSTSSGTNAPTVIAGRLAFWKRRRIIVSERKAMFEKMPNWNKRIHLWLKRLTYVNADAITAVSEGVKDDLINKVRIPAGRITVINNPIISPKLLDMKDMPLEHPWFQKYKVILGVGRLVEQKDYPVMLQSFKKVHAVDPNTRLVILGTGEDEENIKNTAKEIGISDFVFFAGFDKNPYRYMSRCHVYVLSSQYEGMPGTLVQAMACGAACVSTDCHSGPSELIQDNWNNGILVPVGNVDKLASAILSLLSNDAKREQFGQNAQKSVAGYHINVSVPIYIQQLQIN